MSPLRTGAIASAIVLLLTGGCNEPTVPRPPVTGEPITRRAGGLVEITITNLGPAQPQTSARAIAGPGGGADSVPYLFPSPASPMARMITPLSGDGVIQLDPVTTTSVTVGTRAGGGHRFVTATYRVRNAHEDGTPYGDARTNLTFLAVATAGTLGNTPFSLLKRFDGSDAAPGLAAAIVPSGYLIYTSNGQLSTAGPDVLQAYTAGEITGVTGPNVTNTFPYGFVVKHATTPATRTLAASPAVGQYDGVVTFAFKVPLQPTAQEDPFTISAMFLPVDDSETWITQSAEEGDTASTGALALRVAALGGSTVRIRSLLPPPSVQLVASGLSAALYVTAPPGDHDRIFVVRQSGQIHIVRRDTLLPTPFIDLSGTIQYGGEEGLLSMAFHPNYAVNGQFFVFYNDPGSDLQIARYQVSGSPDVADAGSGTVLLSIPHPGHENHNGGLVKFGPDGFLYIGTGDGGGGGDPFENAEDSTRLLGKILRIDVDGGTPYAIPSSNPFVGEPPAAPEVWAYGLRNPWRFSFDRLTGDLYIGDVGQSGWEELDFAPSGDPGGNNYGWDQMEGSHCYEPSTNCVTTGRVLPVHEYDHGLGCTIIGGYAYRGTRIPGMYGRYFFADLCGGWVRSLRMVGGVATDVVNHTPQFGSLSSITSFGQDGRGEVYITRGGGQVYRIVP